MNWACVVHENVRKADTVERMRTPRHPYFLNLPKNYNFSRHTTFSHKPNRFQSCSYIPSTMYQELGILGISAAITGGIQLSGFLVAYWLQTEKFYDVLGGINFLVLGIYSAIDGQYEGGDWSDNTRKLCATNIFSVSRAWLLLFLAWRAHERGGDSRFDEVKNKFGMFLLFWCVQGIWVFCISLPVIFINSTDRDFDGLSVLDYICVVAFAFAVVFEITADVQKSVWVKAGREGGFCQVGVWNFSR